jgi:hypothetical protein
MSILNDFSKIWYFAPTYSESLSYESLFHNKNIALQAQAYEQTVYAY